MGTPTAVPLTEDIIRAVFRSLLGREPGEHDITGFMATNGNLESMIVGAISSAEYNAILRHRKVEAATGYRAGAEYKAHTGWRYLVPQELRVTKTPLKRVLLVGQCLLDMWPSELIRLGFTADIDRLLLTHQPPDAPPYPFESYSFQISQIPPRSVLQDPEYFDWVRNGFSNPAEAEEYLSRVKHRIDFYLKGATAWRAHIPVFVTTFMRSQHNVSGRMLRTYDVRDNLFLLDEMNRHLAEQVRALPNVYLIDIDNIAAVLGRRTCQDDMLDASFHGGLLVDTLYEEEQKRIIKPDRATEHFELNHPDFIGSVWLEAEAMYRTLLQIDTVKMVCIDLDDTLWRSVLSEEDEIDPTIAIGGWPHGLAEALLILKRRGIILSIISKNTESRIREIFPKVFKTRLTLDDFAIIKINWEPKAVNIQQAMQEANLLPRSVVFLDDNPVERAAVKAAFPDVRVIESSHYYWKRILLWSAETQVATISAESSRRTEMIRSQVERETVRASLSRAEFLADLCVRTRLFRLRLDTKAFDRALELLNKTNQFNTTGRRWSRQEFESACRDGLVVACEVSDRLTDYGIVLVAVVLGDCVEQLVMSCRVISLDVELAAMSVITGHILQEHRVARAKSVDTDANLLSRDLFSRAGWTSAEGTWQTSTPYEPPAQVTVLNEIAPAQEMAAD